jgi:hypothetical protein
MNNDCDPKSGSPKEEEMLVHPLNDNTTEPDSGQTLTLEGLEPGSESARRFEITRKDWLAVARIVAVSNRADAKVVSRMFDPQPGEKIEGGVAEDLDTAVSPILDWLDRIQADRIFVSASAVRIRDEHNHLDPGTHFVDFQNGWDDPEIEFETLYRFQHFLVCSEGFRIGRVVSKPVPPTETPERPEDFGVCSDRNLESRGLDFGNDDHEFSFEDDEEDSCSCPNDIGEKAVVAEQAPTGNRRTRGYGFADCGIVGCGECTYEETHALDLVDAFCSFGAKEAGDLDRALGLVRSLYDEFTFADMEEGWVVWRGDPDYRIAAVATCAIRHDTYLLSALSAYLAEPDDPRVSVYRAAKRGALEEVRASYPDELRPADVTAVG